MGLWDDFYKTQMAATLPTTPLPQASALQTGAQQQSNPLLQLISQLLTPKPQPQPQAQGNNIASLITALRNDPVGDYNRLSSLPSSAPGSLSPFNTGFFNNSQGAQVNAYPNQMKSNYVAPTLPTNRLGELYTQLYKNPRLLYQ